MKRTTLNDQALSRIALHIATHLDPEMRDEIEDLIVDYLVWDRRDMLDEGQISPPKDLVDDLLSPELQITCNIGIEGPPREILGPANVLPQIISPSVRAVPPQL